MGRTLQQNRTQWWAAICLDRSGWEGNRESVTEDPEVLKDDLEVRTTVCRTLQSPLNLDYGYRKNISSIKLYFRVSSDQNITFFLFP